MDVVVSDMTPSEKKRIALRDKRVQAARDKLQTTESTGITRRTAVGKAADEGAARAKPRASKPKAKKKVAKKNSVIKTIQDRKKQLRKLSDM